MIGIVLGAVAVADLKAAYTTVADKHISDVMPLFSSDALNFEWAERLTHQDRIWTSEHGYLAYQQHSLPWPMSSRDLLLACEVKTYARDAYLTSECRSVEHPAVPHQRGVVRLTLTYTLWRLEALPGSRTRIHLEMGVPVHAAHGVPSRIVNYAQRSSLRDSVTAFLAAVDRLNLPPHEKFIQWRRSRAEARHAREALAACSTSTSLWQTFFLDHWLLLALAVIAVHCTAFGLLSHWRSSVVASRAASPPLSLQRLLLLCRRLCYTSEAREIMCVS